MNTLKISLESLDKSRKEILFKLRPFFKEKGILAGGTALMLQLYHRRSYDYDLFFPFEISDNFLRLASRTFNSNIQVIINNRNELTFTTSNKIKISFIHFPFKRIYKTLEYKSVIISSYKDIASDKAYAIGRRPQYRDYVDLFTILKNKFPLKKVIEDAKEKFKGEFSEKLLLAQLVYFEDLEDFTIDFIGKEYMKEEIKNFFEKQIINYKKTIF